MLDGWRQRQVSGAMSMAAVGAKQPNGRAISNNGSIANFRFCPKAHGQFES
jgi:hypothetical protein